MLSQIDEQHHMPLRPLLSAAIDRMGAHYVSRNVMYSIRKHPKNIYRYIIKVLKNNYAGAAVLGRGPISFGPMPEVAPESSVNTGDFDPFAPPGDA